MAGLSRVLTPQLEALQPVTYCGIMYPFIAPGHTDMLSRVLGNSTPELAIPKVIPKSLCHVTRENTGRVGTGEGALSWGIPVG